MIRNYLKTALRSLARYHVYSLINIFGLTVGLATCVLIFLWIKDELMYDRFYSNANEIYRIQGNYLFPNGSIETYAASTYSLAEAARSEIPEIDQLARATWTEGALLRHGETAFTEPGFYADSTFFSVLPFPLTAGNRLHPLPDNKSIVITERTAKKLFGNDDPIGKVIQVNKQFDLAVSAVVRDIPMNSSIRFEWISPIDLWAHENPWCSNWRSGGLQTLLTLEKGANSGIVSHKLHEITKRKCEDCINQPFLYKLADLHLYGTFKDGKPAGGRIDQVRLVGAVALLILIIACINFMNLATARSATRMREVGVRKCIGALPSALIFQFMFESMLLSFFALFLALAIVQLMLPVFNDMIHKQMHLDFTNGWFNMGILCITLVCGLLAGSYPAVFLAALRPSSVLKGAPQSMPSGGHLRRGLVVVQFVTSITLIVGSIVVYEQISFISSMDLGYEKENVVVIDLHNDLAKNAVGFKKDLFLDPSVKGAAFGGSNIFQIPITTHDPKWPNKQEGQSISFKVYRCDQDFIPLMGVKLISGRNFSDLNNQDKSNYIINKKAMEAMGLKLENAVGTELDMWNGKGTIVGVTNDFNTGNLHEAIDPLIFMFSQQAGDFYFIRTDGNPKALTHIEQVVKKYDPDYPFHYSFLTDVFNTEYSTEVMIGKLALCFTIIAITISCLGLFGLSLFTAERRIKELGIRKVLGASTTSLVSMLCVEFLRLVLIALIVALPFSWYVSNQYLKGYAFHAQLTIWDFALPAFGILSLALLTVGYQSHHAAAQNPARSLRNE